MHHVMIQCAARVFPSPQGHQRLALWQTPPMQAGIKSMWQHYRDWKRARQQHPGNPLFISRCYHTFKEAHKAFRRAGQAAKKHWFYSRLQDLQAAAASKDSRALHAGVRTLAPKRIQQKVQLRNADGHLQDPTIQVRQLEQHYRKLYATDEGIEIEGAPRASIQIMLKTEELAKAIAGLSPHKATPPGLATNSLWKVNADIVAPTLCKWMMQWTEIPALWKNAWLALVPKIPRPLSPKNLRPIGLTESSGRAYASILQAQLRPFAEEFLKDGAQFAYLPGRNAAQAIHRVAMHCRYVQQKCSYSTPTVVDRHAQMPKQNPHFAGIQLSLDLSSAFDLLDWRLLDRALLAAQVPLTLRNQIMSWHHEIHYVLNHLGQTAQVCARKGLRQGCKLAPLLWTMALEQIFRELVATGDALLTVAWLQGSLTIYADDIHLQELMYDTHELDKMVYRFSKVLDALSAHGMVINSGKSAILLRHRGFFIKGWLRRHLIHKPDGDMLRFRSPAGTIYEIPLREQHTYLGIRISYHSQARHAVTYRLQVAQRAWQRLKSILCSGRHLAQSHRLQLWRTTILPTLLYGIAASNPDSKDIRRVQIMITKQVRAITKSFAHMKHESTRDLLRRCAIMPVAECLLKEAQALHGSLAALSARVTFVSAAHVEQARRITAHLHIQVQQQWQVPEDGEHSGHLTHQCSECHKAFASFRLLRAHEAKWHNQPTPSMPTAGFDRLAHSLSGLPTCKHCQQPFRQWDGLVKHIQRNRCQVLRRLLPSAHSQPQVPTPPRRSDDVRSSSQEVPCSVPPSVSAGPLTFQDMQNPTTFSAGSLTETRPAPVAAPDPAPSPTAGNQPLQLWPSVQARIRAGRWSELPQDKQVQEYLRHHCPVCFQWVATTASIKSHLTKQHPEWTTCQPDALKLLQSFRRHTVVPCRYCHLANINKDRHWRQCHVLHICAFLAVSHDRSERRLNGSGCTGEAVLVTGRPSEARARDGADSLENNRGGQASTSWAAGQGQKQRQGQQRQGQGLLQTGSTKLGRNGCGKRLDRGLHQWFRRAADKSMEHPAGRHDLCDRSRVAHPPSEHSFAAGAKTGASHCIHETGHGGLPFHSLRTGGDDSSVVRSCRQVAQDEGGEIGSANLLAEDSHVQAAVNLIASETQRDLQGQRSNDQGGEAKLGGRSKALEASHLEPGTAETGGGQHPSTDVDRGPAGSASTDAESCQRGNSTEVQVGASTYNGSHGGVDSISDLHLTETRGRALVEHIESMDRSSFLAHAGLSSPPGSTSLRQSHPADLESDVSVIPSLKALLQLVLHNPTNLCYLHSTIMAIHWVMLQVRLHDARAPLPPQVLTQLCPPSTSPTSNIGPVQVLQSLPWLLMLRAWPQLHQQHDVAEFAMYLLPRFSPMGMHGCWEARNYSPDGVITMDTGTLETPLPLQLNAGDTICLQQSVEGWCSQTRAKYALCTATPILCLQLLRFSTSGEAVRKDIRPVKGLTGTIRIPVYTAPTTLNTELVSYQVAAVQHHFGERPSSGHYRTMLHGQKQFAAGRFWLTDDSRCAMPTASDAYSDSAYLVWLRQAE